MGESIKTPHLNLLYTGDDDYESNQGRWSADEHRLFIEAVNQFGREWDKVQAIVKTRSLAQVRSHAQKYFLKLSRSEDLERMHENELWALSAQPQGSGCLNALVVLDIMGSVLKKLKVKRDEITSGSGAENTSSGSSTSSSSAYSVTVQHRDGQTTEQYTDCVRNFNHASNDKESDLEGEDTEGEERSIHPRR